METKFKIIETKDYILAASNEEAKEREICVDIDEFYSTPILNIAYRKNIRPDSIKQFKVVAFQPKDIAPESLFNAKLQSDNNTNLQKVAGLPLLPEMSVEDDVERLAEKIVENDKNDASILWIKKFYFKKGYKTATKKYSEAIDAMQEFVDRVEKRDVKSKYTYTKFKNIIQSLKQPKTPTHFLAEIETTKSSVFRENDNVPYAKLKTKVVDGKTYLVGKYLYE